MTGDSEKQDHATVRPGLPDGWKSRPSPGRWDLLLSFDDLAGGRSWYRLASDGRVFALPFVHKAHDAAIAPGGSRAALFGHTFFFEGTHAVWTILTALAEPRTGASELLRIPLGCRPAWSSDDSRLAYAWATDAWSNDERRFVSCRPEGQPDATGSVSILAIHDLTTGLVREATVWRIQSLRWRSDDREILAILNDGSRLSLVSFDVESLEPVRTLELTVAPTAQGLATSPDGRHVAFCDLSSDEDSIDDSPFTGYILDTASGQVTPIGPLRWETYPVWSPRGGSLAYQQDDASASGEERVIAHLDLRTGIRTEIASFGEDDMPDEIAGPDLAWSSDGTLIAFVTNGYGGSAIHVVELATGSHRTVLQTNGLVHSLGFVGPAG